MVDNKLVSIIMPVWGVERYIERSLCSVMNQTYGNLEIILIDDCSTDNSIKIAKNYLLRHSYFNFRIYRHESNKGQGAARNTGLNVANGEFIFFMDSDDEIVPNCIESLINAMSNSNADIVTGNRDILDDRTKELLSTRGGAYREEVVLTTIEGIQAYGVQGEMWNKLIKKVFLLTTIYM